MEDGPAQRVIASVFARCQWSRRLQWKNCRRNAKASSDSESDSARADPGQRAATTPVLHVIPQSAGQVQVVYRQAGDKNLLVEYGPLELDLDLRFRATPSWIGLRNGLGKLRRKAIKAD